MKEASKSVKEKGMKTIELNELSAKGYKFPNNELYFPIQVNAICSSQGNEKVTSSAITPYVAPPVAIDYLTKLNLKVILEEVW